MESASWTAGDGRERDRQTPHTHAARRAGAGVRRARYVADSSRRVASRRVQREMLAAGRLSSHSTVPRSESRIPRSVRRGLDLPLLARAFPCFAACLPRARAATQSPTPYFFALAYVPCK
jgi:hypothetical protein